MKSGTLEDELRADLERHGYYPELVFEALRGAIGEDPLVAFVVQQEAAFDRDELRRHMTVLALTSTRLLVSHTDEHQLDGVPHASTTTELVPISRIESVVITRVVRDPAATVGKSATSEVVVTVGWGAVNRIELEVANCADSSCNADHGYTGTASNDDFSLRVSEAADGLEVVNQVLEFASKLSEVHSGGSSSLCREVT
jgi:hypothetical protein